MIVAIPKYCLQIFFVSLLVLLCGCGGGGGGSASNSSASPAIVNGQFKDSNTSGLSFTSGTLNGITDSQGIFSYIPGDTVSFYVGVVLLGTVPGAQIITPIDLISGGDSSDNRVQNIVRFLMMLDFDADPSNGITISNAVQLAAQNWTQVNFATSNLDAELASIISDANVADGFTHILPDALASQNHLESTLRCAYAGAFKGTFNGTDQGNFGILIDTASGNVQGVAYSNVTHLYHVLSGVTPISYEGNPVFVAGIASSGADFAGTFTSFDDVSGSWVNLAFGDSGNFSGSRIGGISMPDYRFTGYFTGTDFGLFSFDIDSANNVTGIAYSVSADLLLSINGTLTGTALNASASDGTVISGDLNTGTGALSGSWSNLSQSGTGVFTGSGCQLN